MRIRVQKEANQAQKLIKYDDGARTSPCAAYVYAKRGNDDEGRDGYDENVHTHISTYNI